MAGYCQGACAWIALNMAHAARDVVVVARPLPVSPTSQRRRLIAHQVEITSCSHSSAMTIGYAEGKLDGREFTASWATGDPIGVLFYDTWLEATSAERHAIAKALNSAEAVPELAAV